MLGAVGRNLHGLDLFFYRKINGRIMKPWVGFIYLKSKKMVFGFGVKLMVGFGQTANPGPSYGRMIFQIGSTFSHLVRDEIPSFMITDIPNTENNLSSQK